MNLDTLKQNLLDLLNEFLSDNEISLDHKVDYKTRLIGSNAIFDSMELVQFIVEVESYLDENLDIEIQLASEKAMSRRTSPFISIDSLSNYIIDEI